MGTDALETLRKHIESELAAAGLKSVRESFRADTPLGPFELANIYADLAATDPKAETVILCTHFDTKISKGHFPEPFVGANDGGSGTAILLELARTLAKSGPRALTYRFLFLDGEEATRWDWVDPDNTYGSRHAAEELKKSGSAARVRACVLLDMLGDKELKIFRDTVSDRRLFEIFAKSAKDQGLSSHIDGPAQELRDDHLPFMAVGIPSLDLIDFDYGPDNTYWHSPKDVLANCSRESLGFAGRIVLGGLPELERSFARR